MAEYYSAQNSQLILSGEYINKLDVEGFSQMLKNPSYCYKFYWLEGLVKLVAEGITETTFGDVIDEMIVNAWYSVLEFHVHLSGFQMGEVRDGLERTVLKLAELSGLSSQASSVEIKNAIKEYEKQLHSSKVQLTHMVPYRALAGFFRRSDIPVNWDSTTRLISYIEHVNKENVVLPYTLGSSSQLKREVHIHPAWAQMICDNAVSILGWIQYEKVKWLQMNNPEVPGLIYKLKPLDEKMRKLGHVRKLWDGVLELQSICDVFTGEPIEHQKYDVDHFIPWSFVMNDELWNLMPMDSSLNSSKSNRLPKWDPFFMRFAENQYTLYRMIQENEKIRFLYNGCNRDNLHSIWAGQELYRPGNSKEEFCGILMKNMQPVYDSARRQGYELWNI